MSARDDLIGHLVGIEPGSPLDLIRNQRPAARENAQKSFLALLAPADVAGFSLGERFAVAAFVAGLHEQPAVFTFYSGELVKAGVPEDLRAALVSETQRGAARGPYGRYPAGPLSVEDKLGPVYQMGEDNRALLGDRLAAALEHAHLLVFHPRDARPEAFEPLLAAGWTTDAIVTLSQLVSFLAFQIRTVAGLRALAAAGLAA
jgi:CMD domain protein